MAWSSDPHILSKDDVLPAEGAAKIVTIANGNRDAFNLQHDRREAKHLGPPFVVGRCWMEVLRRSRTDWDEEISLLGMHIASDTVAELKRITTRSINNQPAWQIKMHRNVTLVGGHAMARVASRAVYPIDPAAPAVTLEDRATAVVLFNSPMITTDVTHVHVLLFGVID